jgi:hypothetical protein
MRARWQLGLLAGLAVCLGGTARAQGPAPPVFFNPVLLLGNESVRQELKLTREQRSKVKKELDTLLEKYKEDRDKLRGMSGEDRQDFFKKRNEDAKKTMAGILDRKQMKRLEQVHLQVLGVDAFTQDEVIQGLKLSDEQKMKIAVVRTELLRRQREIFQAEGDPREKLEKVGMARKEAKQKAADILTGEQKKTWKEIAGETFEIRPDSNP